MMTRGHDPSRDDARALAHVRRAVRLCVAAILMFCHATASAGTSNSLMDISADGRLLACTNRDSGSVTIVDLETHKVLREIAVGSFPEGVTFVGSEYHVAVAVYGDDVVKIVDSTNGKIVHSVDVFDEPYGVVSTPDGKRLFVTLEYPGQVVEIDPNSGEISNAWDAGQFVRGVAVTPDEEILVTEYYTGIVRKLDSRSGKLVDQWQGSPQDSLARQITLHPKGHKAYLPHQRSRTTVAHGAGSIFPYVAVVDLPQGEESRRRRFQMDSFRGTYVVANPWEVAVSPDGERCYVVFAGTEDMFVCGLLDDGYRELEYQATLRLGSNPRAVRVTPDSSRFYVYNALDFTVVGYDAATLRPLASVTVTSWPHSPEHLLGKKLFYSAQPPMSAQRWISCSSCHPDGDPDGRTWQQPEGLRNTQALFGLAATHPIHWSADRDEVQDFEITIRSPLMRGRGLIRGPVHDALDVPNAGRSELLDALAAYTNSHQFRLSPHAKKGLSSAAKRGREIFFSAQTRCAECHSGPWYTDRKMHDVGTGEDDPTEKMGPKFDTPTLLGIYRTAPYLHHGTAASLEELLTTANPDDQHGRTSHLTKEQRSDLIEFLKALPYEQPTAQTAAR